MKLYHAARSSCSVRVRIAIFLKQIPCELKLIDLLKNEHLLPEYQRISNSSLVPALELDDKKVINQSLAILNYLDEIEPRFPLWPKSVFLKSQVMSFCLEIGMDVQPLNNLRVLNYLSLNGFNENKKQAWIENWIITGFKVIESMLKKNPSPFCFGEHASMADLFLYPQVLNAERIKMPLDDFPNIKARFNFLSNHEAFKKAHPENWL